MGIGAALVGGGLGLIGNMVGAKGQKDAASANAAQQQAMFEQGQLATQPFREAGQQALTQQQALMSPEGQSQFYEQYAQGPQFQMMQGQLEDAALRNASATGGLRTGQANVALGEIAPNLMNQAYNQRLMGLQNLTNMGAGAAGQTAGLSTGVGQSTGSQMGTAAGAFGNAFGQSLGQLGGIAANMMSQPQSAMAPLPQYIPPMSNKGGLI